MITLDEVIGAHMVLEEEALCSPGIRDQNLLVSAVEGQSWYLSIFEQYCHVAYSINTYHVFNDGNKRTAFSVLKHLNGLGFMFDDEKLSMLILKYAAISSKSVKDEFIAEVRKCIIIQPS